MGTTDKISISHNLTEKASIGYNIGYANYGTGIGDATYTVSLAIAVNKKVGVYVEPYGSYQNFNKYISNFDTGFTYLQNNNLQFDFSFGVGINQTNNYIAAGISWLIEQK